jgi:hypothetical protein
VDGADAGLGEREENTPPTVLDQPVWPASRSHAHAPFCGETTGSLLIAGLKQEHTALMVASAGESRDRFCGLLPSLA